jgi:CheY-like chemotaxis protein
MRLICDRYEIDAIVVGSGEQAVQGVDANPNLGLVVMDLNLSDISGLEVTRLIREREGNSHHIPIIALTACAMVGDRERCLAAGMDDYLSKPFRIDEFVARVRKWAGEKSDPALAGEPSSSISGSLQL